MIARVLRGLTSALLLAAASGCGTPARQAPPTGALERPSTLDPAATGTELLGSVVDDAGRPVVGAVVKIGRGSPPESGETAEHTSQTTNARGEFVIPAPPEQGIWVKVTAAGFPGALIGTPEVRVRPGDRAPRVRLSAGGRIVGRVRVRGAGSPPEHYSLSLIPWDEPWDDPSRWIWHYSSWPPRGDESLAPGEFRTPHLHPGRYLLEIGVNGALPSRVEAKVVASEAASVGTVSLSTGFLVRGRIQTGDAKPLGVVVLSMTPTGDAKPEAWRGTQPLVARDANDAAFELADAPSGEYDLRVDSAGYRTAFVPKITATQSTVIDLQVVLEPAAFVVVRMLSEDDSPLAQVELRIGQPGGDWAASALVATPASYIWRDLATDATGRCRPGPLAPGRWPVESKAPGEPAWEQAGYLTLRVGDNPETVFRVSR